jgi:hypothetical protein
MVRAIRPLPPPSPAPFRGAALRVAAAGARGLHGLLVGTQERFRLWLALLGMGVRIVLHGERRALGNARLAPERRESWSAFADGLSDFEALDASHLAAFEALAASLSAIDRGGRLQLWERIAGDTR